jgi:hypothetical protein
MISAGRFLRKVSSFFRKIKRKKKTFPKHRNQFSPPDPARIGLPSFD